MTLDEAVTKVAEWMGSDRELILEKCAKEGFDKVAGQAHHGFGTYVRNELQLWHPPGEELRTQIWDAMSWEAKEYYKRHWRQYGKEDFYQGPNMHADDASHELIQMALKKICAG